MFTTVIFIIAKTWKLPRYPLAGEWTINCGISSTKMNGLSNHEKTKRNLKMHTTNEISQSKKAMHFINYIPCPVLLLLDLHTDFSGGR